MNNQHRSVMRGKELLRALSSTEPPAEPAHLNLRFNRLSALPAEIAELSSLEYLDLRARELAALPEGMDRLERLRKPDLRWNRLRSMPRCLAVLSGRGCIVHV